MSSIRSLTAIANDRDYTKTHTAEYDTNQSGATLVTPTDGKVLKIAGVFISTESTDGKCRVYFSDDENDTTQTVVTVFAADSSIYVPCLVRGDRNAVLKFDTTYGADDNFFILVNYDEE
jgi:hypothetical protein